MAPAARPLASIVSLPPSALTTSWSPRLGVNDADVGRQPAHARPLRHRPPPDGVVAVGAVDAHPIGLAVSSCARTGQVDVDPSRVGAAQVTHHDVVGATQGVEVDVLDIVQVHRDVGHVAEEAHALAVGRDVDVLAMLAPLNSIVSMPSWPSTTSLPSPGSHWKLIVACAEQRHVVALVAVHEVVTVAAQQLVGTVAAPNRIVARAAVDGELHGPCRHVRSVDPCHLRPAR